MSYFKKINVAVDTGTGSTYENVTVQNPFPVDGDSVYKKDIWEEESSLGSFSGQITDLFDDLHTQITDSSSDNPKTLFIHFKRTVVSNAIGLGNTGSGNFSNVKLEIVNSGGIYTTVIDESSSATKYTTRTFQLPITAGFNALRITFHTADTISLSNCVILKSLGVVSRVQATKPDNTVTDINATTGGNLKISLEELENQISTNSNSQLNTSPHIVDEYGVYQHQLGDNVFQGAVIAIPPEHHEIHCGDSYTAHHVEDLSNSATIDYVIIVPDWGTVNGTNTGSDQTIKVAHLVGEIFGEAETSFWLYENPTVSDNGSALNVVNRNRNSTFTDFLNIYRGATITAVGSELEHAKFGSGKLIGGGVSRTDEWVLRNNTTYLLRVTNDTTSNNYHTIRFQYYIHPGV